jgi:hypothetical protein
MSGRTIGIGCRGSSNSSSHSNSKPASRTRSQYLCSGYSHSRTGAAMGPGDPASEPAQDRASERAPGGAPTSSTCPCAFWSRRRLISLWDYRHLRVYGVTRIVGASVAAAGVVCLSYGAYGWAAFFLVGGL